MTAVEWVIQYLNNVKPHEFCSIETIKEILEQAKEMEKEQIKQAQQVQKGDYCAVCGCREFWNDEEE